MRLVLTDSFERLASALGLHQLDFLFTLMPTDELNLWLLYRVPGLISQVNSGSQPYHQLACVQMKNTSLHIAALEGHIDLVRLLLKHKASVYQKNKVGVEFWARNTSVACQLLML